MNKPHWNHDICSCGAVSCGTWCISGCICSPCQLAKLHSHVLGEKPPRVCSAIPCLLQWSFFVFPIVPFVQQVWVRAAIRDELHIEESNCDTCVIATCCNGSAVVQMAATLRNQRHVPAFVFMDDDADLNPLLDESEKNLDL